ncbi:MAG: hypothetical protein M3Y22_03780, partial [Pseudomonadota bacterium]|nr:hypothetical protein [Pseudomonadota bacterium]
MSAHGKGERMQPTTRIEVQVTFLRADTRNPVPRPLPHDSDLIRVENCSVAFYRFLYNTVGAPYVWWLRRSLSDEALGGFLRNKAISV